MFSFRITTTPVFVMHNEDDISIAREGCIVYEDHFLNFIEKDGFYAYSEFFSEGDWPNKYYKDEEKDDELHGLKLKMVSGGWCRNFSDLIQTIPHHSFYEILDLLEEYESGNMEIEIVDRSEH
jgi:hypothetical protein